MYAACGVALLLFSAVERASSAASDSFCASGSNGAYTPATVTSGNQVCSGSVFLSTDTVLVGIHPQGSYGTAYNPHTHSGFSQDLRDASDTSQFTSSYNGGYGRLGFKCDVEEDGWNDNTASGAPDFQGDFFTPGSPWEGWQARWYDTSASTTRMTYNEGLVPWSGYSAWPASEVLITSDDDVQLTTWIGTKNGLRIAKVTQLVEGNQYFTTSVTVTNTLTTDVTDFYYLRLVNPDNDVAWTGSFSTQNYVTYQYQVPDDPYGNNDAEYDSSADYNGAAPVLVSAFGPRKKGYVGLGTIVEPQPSWVPAAKQVEARANFPSRTNIPPADIVKMHEGTSSGFNLWETYGGKDVDGRTDCTATYDATNDPCLYRNYLIGITFKYGEIDAGTSVQFHYAYILDDDDLDEALDAITAVTVTQPTSIATGDDVLIQAAVQQSFGEPVDVAFKVFARLKTQASPAWHAISTATSRITLAGGSYIFQADRWNSELYFDGNVQVMATARYSNNDRFRGHKALVISNAHEESLKVCFTEDTSASFQFVQTLTHEMAVYFCGSGTNSIASVTFYVESVYRGVYLTDTEGTYTATNRVVDVSGSNKNCYGYDINVSADNRNRDEVLMVRAESKDSSGNVYNAVLSGVVVERNYAPTNIVYTTVATLTENLQVGTLLGTLTTTDANDDDDGQHQYTLTNDAGGRLALSTSNGVGSVTIAANVNYEEIQSLDFTVRTDDQSGESGSDSVYGCCYTKAFSLSVTDVNEAPRDLRGCTSSTLSSCAAPADPVVASVSEALSGGGLVTWLHVSDDETSQTRTYQVLSPVLFTATGGGGGVSSDFARLELASGGQLDYETTSTYNVQVQVSDNGSPPLFTVFTVQVDLTDANEAPTAILIDAAATKTVDENLSDGATVGTLSATDEDAGDTATFALTSDAGGLFAVDGATLKVAAGQTIDYETVGSSVDITVAATDSGGAVYTQDVTIIINDVDEPPQVGSVTCYVDEGRRAGDTVASTQSLNLCFVDATAAGGEELDFTITDLDSINHAFSIQSCSGLLFVNQTDEIDHETSDTFEFVVNVAGAGGSNDNSNVTIIVVDVNEAPSWETLPDDITVAENASVGHVVVDFSSYVSDDDNDTSKSFCCGHTFLLEAGNDDFKFSMDGAGQLTLAGELDFETRPSYVLTVSAEDPGGLRTSTDVTIQVLDMNDPPRLTNVPSPGSAYALVAENADFNTAAGLPIYALDDDHRANLTYSIASWSASPAVAASSRVPFAINTSYVDYGGGQGNWIGQLVVNDSSLLNYEQDNDFNTPDLPGRKFYVVVKVTDDADASVNATYEIHLQDEDDTPVLLPVSGTIYENNPQGTAVNASGGGALSIASGVTDEDYQSTFLYTVEDYFHDSSNTFAIDGTTGAVTLNALTINHERRENFTYAIRVTDNTGRFAIANMTIRVLDVPEAPTLLDSYLGEIAENEPANSPVVLDVPADLLDPDVSNLTISAVDDDVGETLTYRITTVNDGTDLLNHFRLTAPDAVTGEVNVVVDQANLNFEGVLTQYRLNVEVEDSTSRTDSAIVTINVINRNDAPSISDRTCLVAEDAATGTVLCTLSATDQDSTSTGWGNLTYTLTDTQNAAAGTFELSNDGTLSMDATAASWKAHLGYTDSDNPNDNPSNFQATLTVNVSDQRISTEYIDGGGLSDVATITVQMTNVNQPPQCNDPCAVTGSVAEDATSGTVVATLWGPALDSRTYIYDNDGNHLNFTIQSGNLGGVFEIDDVSKELKVAEPAGATSTCGWTQSASGCQCVGGSGSTCACCIAGGEQCPAPNSDVCVELGHTDDCGNSCQPLDYDTVPSYSVYVVATEDDAFGLSSTFLVPVTLQDVNEPPVFEDGTRSISENIAAGPTSVAAFVAVDEDAADAAATYSAAFQGDAADDIFTIDSSTAEISLDAGGVINYEVTSQYVYTVTWSSRGVTASADLTLNVQDLAERPSVTASQSFSLTEGASAVTLGSIAATDPDFYADGQPVNPCGQNCGLKYYIRSIGGGDFGIFSLGENSGVLTATNPADFENVASYDLAVEVVDNAGTGLASGVTTVTVDIVNVNDCAVLGVHKLDGTVATPTGVSDAVFSTAGGEKVLVTGTSLGPTAGRMAGDGLVESNVTVSMRYRKDLISDGFLATNCERFFGTIPSFSYDNAIVCDTVTGIGENLQAVVTVTTAYSTGTDTCTTVLGSDAATALDYEAPTITTVTTAVTGGVLAFDTEGGEMLTVTGTNFGTAALGHDVSIEYGDGGDEYTASCTVSTDNTGLTCPTSPGTGTSHPLFVRIDNQVSSNSATIGYKAPVIASITAPSRLDTRGAETVTITGRSFGLGGLLAVTYGTAPNAYTATGCAVTTAHREITCTTAAGYGQNLAWKVSVRSQESQASSTTTSYKEPVVLSVGGPGSHRARTEGGESVVIDGDQFGPASTTLASDHVTVAYGRAAGANTFAFSGVGCRVSTAHTQIECTTAPGTGKDHSWKVTIGGQVSAPYAANTSYAPPIVASYEGLGATDAETNGNQVVQVLGRNFGRAEDMVIESVTYSRPNGTIFDVSSNCTVSQAHTRLTCHTLPGAGGELRWSVIVDGQLSESPSTSYGIPSITAIVPASLSVTRSTLSVYGGETLLIFGNNFGPTTADSEEMYGEDFERTISYGGNGDDYTAADCVVLTHEMVRCTTVEGIGAAHRWLAAVDNQESSLSTVTTSYAPPQLTSIDPSIATSPGSNVTSQMITLTGSNFGCSRECNPDVFFNGVQVPDVLIASEGGSDRLTFEYPAYSYETMQNGVDLPVHIVLGGQSSNSVTFDYEAPYINKVDPFEVGTLKTLQIRGRSFGGNPRVLWANSTNPAPGEEVELAWDSITDTHDRITINDMGERIVGFVKVVQGGVGRSSNYYSYEFGDPVLLATGRLAAGLDPSDAEYTSPQRFATSGNEELVIIAQSLPLNVDQYGSLNVTVGGRVCDIKSRSEPACQLNGGSTTNEDACACAHNAEYCAAEPGATYSAESLTWSSLAQILTDNGVSTDFYDTTKPLFRITCEMPAGQGTGNDVIIDTEYGATQDCDRRDGSYITQQKACLDYLPPMIYSIEQPDSKPTQGGWLLELRGEQFGLTPAVELCLGASDETAEACEQSSLALNITTQTHTELSVTMPAYQGSEYKVRLTVGNQVGYHDAGSLVGYDPPTITDPALAFTQVSTEGSSVPVVLSGANLGTDRDLVRVFLTNTAQRRRLTFDPDVGASPDDLGELEIVAWTAHTQVQVTVPSFVGRNWDLVVVVGNSFSTFEDVFSYLPPDVTLPPSTLQSPTEGGVLFTLTGTNFGTNESVPYAGGMRRPISLNGPNSLVIADANGDTDRNIPITSSSIVRWVHDELVFRTPEGQGRNKVLELTVGGQLAANRPPFEYQPPQITAVTYDEDLATTDGGFYLTISGNSLGISAAQVRIKDPISACGRMNDDVVASDCAEELGVDTYEAGERMCSFPDDDYDYDDDSSEHLGYQTHNRIVCRMPPGVGKDLNIELLVDGVGPVLCPGGVLGGDTACPPTFSYPRPEITYHFPLLGNARGISNVRVEGTNFGPWVTPLNLTFFDSEYDFVRDDCEDARYNVFTGEVVCPLSPNMPVGDKRTQLSIAFQDSVPFTRFAVGCEEMFYGIRGEICTPCGEPEITGFLCNNTAAAGSQENPVAIAGWWNIEYDVDGPLSKYCSSEVLAGTNFDHFNVTGERIPARTACPSMWPCVPNEACLGNNTCAYKYLDEPDNERCSRCDIGFFRLNGECIPCPKNAWIIITGGVLAILTGVYIAHKLNEKKVNLGIISIGVDYAQVLAIFATSNVEWPRALVDLYNILSAFNLNIDLAAPECWSESIEVPYDMKWAVIESIPVVMISIATLIYALKWMYKWLKHKRSKLNTHAAALYGNVLMIIYYLYLYLTNTTLTPWNCQDTVPPDPEGRKYIKDIGTEHGECYVDGSIQQRLEPWAAITFCVYTIGFPAFIAFMLWKNKEKVVRDQYCRAKRFPPSVLKQREGLWSFRKKYSRMYYQFKPKYFFWILIIILRKFSISVCALLFRELTTFQLCTILLTMFVSYSLQVKFSPYMSSRDYDEISLEFDRLMEEQEANISSSNQAQRYAELYQRHKAITFTNVHGNHRLRAAEFLFDYNSVEAILLFCAVLVALSGIAFDSDQMSANQRETLAYVMIFIVSSSLMYFTFVLFSEFWVAFFPEKELCGLEKLIIALKEEEEEIEDDTKFTFHANPIMEKKKTMEAAGAQIKVNAQLYEDIKQRDQIIDAQKAEIRNLNKQLFQEKQRAEPQRKGTIRKRKTGFGVGLPAQRISVPRPAPDADVLSGVEEGKQDYL